jgi:hypothetical protein
VHELGKWLERGPKLQEQPLGFTEPAQPSCLAVTPDCNTTRSAATLTRTSKEKSIRNLWMLNAPCGRMNNNSDRCISSQSYDDITLGPMSIKVPFPLLRCISEHIKTSKIWGSCGSDYEECRLMGYTNPVRTSKDTHYVSATDPSRCWFDVFTAVTIKNAVWDIKAQFVSHRRHITSPLLIPAG